MRTLQNAPSSSVSWPDDLVYGRFPKGTIVIMMMMIRMMVIRMTYINDDDGDGEDGDDDEDDHPTASALARLTAWH